MINREEMNRQENIAYKELVTAIRGFQVVNQTRTAAVLYKGAKLHVNEKGITEVIVLSEGGRASVVGQYQDHDRAKRILEGMYQRYLANDDVYPMPAE